MTTATLGASCGHLHMDEACLHVSDPFVNKLLAQSTECQGCPLWKVWDNDTSVGSFIVVNTTWPTILLAESVDSSSCQILYQFGEFGEYSLDKTNSNCFVDVTKTPVDVSVPLWVVAGTLIAAVAAQVAVGTARRLRRRQRESEDDGSSADPLMNDDANSQSDDSRRRVVSLDSFRGLAVMLMIFVNYGGGGYWFFRHSTWNGLTVADVVFPWFLWIMGLSLRLSLDSQSRRGRSAKDICTKVLKRSAILFFLGLFLNSKGRNDFRTLRIPGVLQRFALSYLGASLLELQTPKTWIRWIALLCLSAAHTAIIFLLHVPGCPRGYLGPGGLHAGGDYENCTGGAAGYIDRTLLGDQHLYQHPTAKRVYDTVVPFDPEGTLGVLTSTILVLLGCRAGDVLLRISNWRSRVLRWLVLSVALGLVAGALCDFSKDGGIIPVNKNLWSLSFVLSQAATAKLVFAIMQVSHLHIAYTVDKC